MKRVVMVALGAACACFAAPKPEELVACPVSENLRGHENIEWTRAYAYGLTDSSRNLPRVLLVGDSIVCGYEGGVRHELRGKMNVSYLATSYCVTSPGYMKLLSFHLGEAKYDVIHFNNGLHSLDTPTEDWVKGFRKALELIRAMQPQAKIVWATSTPLKDLKKTAKSRELNEAGAKIVAEMGGIATDDLFAAMDPLDRQKNWKDTYHFKPHVIAQQVKLVAAAICAAKASGAGTPDAFALQRAEFAKYYREITGKGAPDGAVSFAIDPKVSKSGRDAYRIVSSGACVTITGSNMRSVWYGLYDLLERRGGCHWFWDGDVVPKKDSIDLSGLDVHEEAHFEYRAIRYFAHRGLTRFQAEHWGLDDWKKEIDWLLKRRLNTFMLRIGQDDVFQRAFPDVCPYPDASKPQPGMYKGYNDRTLFWSLQFRGQLRHDLQKYAFDRGLMSPEDFGTMSHWYSPTPDSYLAGKKPPFLPQSNSTHAEPHLRVWDIRTGDWAEEYWKLTKTAIDAYDQGAPEPRLLHTIGLGERMCYKDRKANFDLKVKTLNQFLDIAKRDYPDAKLLIAGWDFYNSWTNEEVREYLKTLDKDRVLLWDYEADHAKRGATARNFTNWDVIGKFPYTYSVFLAYEKALDARANYPIIEERQKLVQDDPFCKGYVFWPESSHTDTLLLRFFTANAWSDKPITHGEVLDEFCASRYGASAEAMKAAWKAVLPASWLRDWGNNYSSAVLGIGNATQDMTGLIDKWKTPVEDAKEVFTLLQGVPWDDPFVRRDAIDIARMVLDRMIAVRVWEFSSAFAKWRKGKGTTSVQQQDDILAHINAVAGLCDKMADLLALHTDYSLWESYQRLDAVEKIRNPLFEKTLFENASCGYCRSHQYELARYWYAPHVKAVASKLAKAVAANDRKAAITVNGEEERLALKAKPLESLKPTLPRTEENFRKVLREVLPHPACHAALNVLK